MPDTLQEAIPAECMAVLVQLWDYLDDNLDPNAAEALRAHLMECAPCFEYRQFQESYRDAMRAVRLAGRAAPWDVRARLASALAVEATRP